MIELPEATVLAGQMNEALKGKTVVRAVRRDTPHKFAFVGSHSDDEFSQIVSGRRIGRSRATGNIILTEVLPDYLLSLGCGGERITYHETAKTIPKKHQLLFQFDSDDYLTVTISGWGETRLIRQDGLDEHPHIPKDKLTPLSKDFTLKAFRSLIADLPEGKKCSAKKFFVSEPGLNGIGNGVIQDIFYYSGIHPKQEMAELSESQVEKLYEVTCKELQKMVDLGGRDSERDLFDEFGQYERALHSRTVGTQCRFCKSKIEKESYLGGTIYFCPSCQKL